MNVPQPLLEDFCTFTQCLGHNQCVGSLKVYSTPINFYTISGVYQGVRIAPLELIVQPQTLPLTAPLPIP